MRRLEIIAIIIGLISTVILHGLLKITTIVHWELGATIVLAMFYFTLSLLIRYVWNLSRKEFLKQNLIYLTISGLWLLAILVILIIHDLIPKSPGRLELILDVSEICIVLRGLYETIILIRRVSSRGWNPALIVVGSFVVLISIGTILLMFPSARAQDPAATTTQGAPFLVALFTSTSASCVTGLIVVPTGTYWSRTGQTIIMFLFQIGGLGILTFGAFFAAAFAKTMQIRESVTFSEMLESHQRGGVRRLLLAILGITIFTELTGAFFLSGLWPELPWHDRIYHSLFHSISAYCNAGFSLMNNNLMGMGDHWQISIVMPALIIIGGLGFVVNYNFLLYGITHFSNMTVRKPLFNHPTQKVRLTISSRLVFLSTIFLLVGGTLGLYLLESIHPEKDVSSWELLNSAWFQSVTFRTAGFNTVDLGAYQPQSKLFAILLMFIGASPGSTGGGVKTVVIALALLSVWSLLKGRDRVEIMGRTISSTLINRSLTIISLGILVLMSSTLLVVLFENRQDIFLDHLFETTSAFATVGVSTGITSELTAPSQWVIMITMLIGRVGPLTVMIALSNRGPSYNYRYPEESIHLG
ncbi:MAG: potassium transporter Trk [Planctomycetes bacterium]|nr:potassium transporter Trk [Planctomycetota bacterium]MCH9727515.1 potassium transporter Trk [Planctomycetota bacterium]MCH9777503.1 potassium transporter Trk [Planctomycetota bacterium]MCH9792371.1 potassium transporter Trk [Planctomycetota bacterium]